MWIGGSSQSGEDLGCLFMSKPRLGATWACPCSADPELCSPAQQHGCVNLCFVFRLKVILALELELAHVWSALEQMCGCLRRWEFAHQELSIWKQCPLTSCTARNKVYFRKAKPHFRSGSRTEKIDTSLHSRAYFVFLADHTRSTSTFQCLLLYFQN